MAIDIQKNMTNSIPKNFAINIPSISMNNIHVIIVMIMITKWADKISCFVGLGLFFFAIVIPPYD